MADSGDSGNNNLKAAALAAGGPEAVVGAMKAFDEAAAPALREPACALLQIFAAGSLESKVSRRSSNAFVILLKNR